MNRTSTSQFGFFNLRVLIGLFVVLAGAYLALAGLGAFSSSAASAAPAKQYNAGFNGVDISLLPPGLDCARIHDLGYDKMENFRAGLIMKACGAGEEDSASSAHAASRLVQSLLPTSPLFIGGADVDVVAVVDDITFAPHHYTPVCRHSGSLLGCARARLEDVVPILPSQ